jgi:hypothetical protein
LPKHLDLEYSPETRHLTFPELRARLNDLTEFCEEFKRLGGWKPGWAPE